MKQTRDVLMIIFWGQLLLPVAFYVCGDFLDVDLAVLSGVSAQERYVVSVVMILLTLALVPLALRLFKVKRIHDDLISRQAEALRKWGSLRLAILGILLSVNTILYYIFGFEPAFGYLAVVVMLTLPFVYPTMNRCLSETEELVEEEV